MSEVEINDDAINDWEKSFDQDLQGAKEVDKRSILSELEKDFGSRKAQEDLEKQIQSDRYQKLIDMAVEMAEGNRKRDESYQQSRKGNEGARHPQAEQVVLDNFRELFLSERHERETELKLKQEQFDQIKATFENLKTDGKLTDEEIATYQAQIAQQEAELKIESDNVHALGVKGETEYNQLAYKFRNFAEEQASMANDPETFAIKTVLELAKDDLTEEQQASFEKDAKEIFKEKGDAKFAEKRLEEKAEDNEFYANVVKDFEQRFSDTKKKLEEALATFSGTDEGKPVLLPRFHSMIAEQMHEIEKLQKGIFFRSSKHKESESAINALKSMKEHYKDRLYQIYLMAHDLMSEARYKDQNVGEGVQAARRSLGTVTLLRVSEYAKHESVRQPDLQDKLNELNNAADITQQRAKVVSLSIENFYEKILKTTNELNVELDNLIDKKLQDYTRNFNKRKK